MSDYDLWVGGFRRVKSGIQFTNIREGRTGRLASNGTVDPDPTAELPPPYIWIREGENGERGQTRALIVGVSPDQADVPIQIGENSAGELCAIAPNTTVRNVSVNPYLPYYGTPTPPPEMNNAIIRGDQLKPGRLRPSSRYVDSSGNPNTLRVYIEPFWYNGKKYGDVDPDTAASVPGSSGQMRWVVVYQMERDKSTGLANGAAVTYASSAQLLEEDIEDITLPPGAIPCGAIVLTNGQAVVNTSNTRFVDAPRSWLDARQPRHNYAAAAAPTVNDDEDDGYDVGSLWVDVINEHIYQAVDVTAGAAVWLQVDGGGVSDAADVTYTPAVVADWNGSTDPGDAADAFDQLAERVKDLEGNGVGTTTIQTRTVLYDNTLGSADTFDPSGISQDYDDLIVELEEARGSTAAAGQYVRCYANNDTTAANYRYASLEGGTGVAGAEGDAAYVAYIPAASAPSDTVTRLTIHIPNYTAAKHKQLIARTGRRTSAGDIYNQFFYTIWENTGAINRLTLSANGDNFEAGTRLRIIGVKEQAIGGAATYADDAVSSPPTAAELTAAFGAPDAPTTGKLWLLDDGGGDADVYLVSHNGTSWWYTAMTKAT